MPEFEFHVSPQVPQYRVVASRRSLAATPAPAAHRRCGAGEQSPRKNGDCLPYGYDVVAAAPLLATTHEFEFHVSRKARQKYLFDEALFALNGNVVLADFAAARRFAENMTKVRVQIIPASEVNAMGLIDEILHILVRQYEKQDPGVMQRALDHIRKDADITLLKFTEEFPPLTVYRGEIEAGVYLDLETAGRPNRQSTLEEMLLLYLANANSALEPYRELFDDEELRRTTAYEAVISGLQIFFTAQAGLGFNGETLFEALMAPIRRAPHSLQAQLEFLLERWGTVLGEDFVLRILRSIDFVREEIIRRTGPGGFGGEAPVLTYTGQDYTEYERFSQDKDWMPCLVLIAKNSFVWLDQLSKKYQRPITHLDHIPDEELDLLKQRGITGLWLIGLWERSIASQKIKQMTGNPEAVASAYSLMDYQIAADLGGWEALQNLRWRAWQHGIRLSADMVPNHMGIDSSWVVEHPDWFLSLRYSPYPNYSFNGADLSNDNRVGIFLEDHYYDKTDAAVVFKRLDRWTGEARYVYHGNDGTSMPWNDTAQLDYSKAEVREAVIQAILHVARNFPIIRFDAAMTLAKKHIQRLWFPEPGQGGVIPSRSEHGMTRAQFDAAVPEEFWREVVDRVAAEVPDTLLLAEAFWMMEGYFVRTLGMHRVYNSAFMHMLRDEDNAKYRQVMKNTLEFDPQVLKRYVNFMNNPDEKTAAEQFGATEKYFGVCTMMVTLPGLPMFGHGQVEGYREKYGMEYRHAKWDESADDGLVRGHEGRIFPLTHRRTLFAEVENFLLYDFYTQDGNVNEDVFAYSNGFVNGYGAPKERGQADKRMERGLVIYHNKYAETRGWIKTSAAFMDKASGNLIQKTLSEGLGLSDEGYAIFKDYVTGQEYIRPCRELVEKGLFVLLGAYQCHVFLDWRFVSGDQWKAVYDALNGAGVVSVQGKWKEMSAAKAEVKEEKPKKATKKRAAEKRASRRRVNKSK
jgi:glycosidase